MQARLDFQSGMLYSQERDFKTAYSYFFESFEGYDQLNDRKRSVPALKMMIMCKDMINKPDDVTVLFTGKMALQYSCSQFILLVIHFAFLSNFYSSIPLFPCPSALFLLFYSIVTIFPAYRQIQAMLAINKALEQRSLHAFQEALSVYPDELGGDFGVSSHLQELSDTLFEQHLGRLIEPFSVVEISHIAELIGMNEEQVEQKFVLFSLFFFCA